MAAKKKLLLKSDDPDRLGVLWDVAARRVKNQLGLQMKVAEPDKAKVVKLMEKAKKPFELLYVLDKTKFSVELRVGTTVEVFGTTDLAAEKDMAKRRETMRALETFELVTRAEVEAFERANPDPKELEAAKSDVRRLEMDLNGDVADRKTIAAFTKYDSGGRAGGYDVSALLLLWLKEKKPSWAHYVEFVDDVAAGKDPKQVFDRYVKDGAEYPVNLPPALQGPIEKAVAAGKAPDLKPARGLIVKMIEQKFIPLFKKDRLPVYDKSMKETALKLKALKAQLVGK